MSNLSSTAKVTIDASALMTQLGLNRANWPVDLPPLPNLTLEKKP